MKKPFSKKYIAGLRDHANKLKTFLNRLENTAKTTNFEGDLEMDYKITRVQLRNALAEYDYIINTENHRVSFKTREAICDYLDSYTKGEEVDLKAICTRIAKQYRNDPFATTEATFAYKRKP